MQASTRQTNTGRSIELSANCPSHIGEVGEEQGGNKKHQFEKGPGSYHDYWTF